MLHTIKPFFLKSKFPFLNECSFFIAVTWHLQNICLVHRKVIKQRLQRLESQLNQLNHQQVHRHVYIYYAHDCTVYLSFLIQISILKSIQCILIFNAQGAKKIIFTACHSGKLKLAFTSSDVISTSPKNVLFFCYSNSS